MKNEMVKYEGRIVSTEGFRVFVYGVDGQEKLVNSWEDYLHHIGSGIWFSNKDKISVKSVEKPSPKHEIHPGKPEIVGDKSKPKKNEG